MSMLYWRLLMSATLLLKQVISSSPTVWTFQDHGEAIYGWNEAFLSGHLSGPATLVHFDSHADMDLPFKWFDIQNRSSLTLAGSVGIDNFIPIAILAGLVDRVVWVKPEWGIELEYGSYNYVVAEDKEEGIFRTDAPFSSDPIFTSTDIVESLDNVHRYSVDVVPVTQQALDSLNLTAGPWILDIDLDVFSTENLGAEQLRETLELDIASVERFEKCMCSQEDFCEKEILFEQVVPSEFADVLLDLNEDQFEDLFDHICRAPIHYSSTEEVDAAVDVIFGWVEKLLSKGSKRPSVITISESTNGFLPEQDLLRVEDVAPRLAELFGSDSPPKWIECSSCANISIYNDLEVDIDIYWVDDSLNESIFEDTIISGEEIVLTYSAGETLELVAEEGVGSRSFLLSVALGQKMQQFVASQLESHLQCSMDNSSQLSCEKEKP